jgi:hypothetical protein
VKALNQPESWWGWHGWNHPQPLSIAEIISDGTLSARMAALFWIGMERGASMIFAADPPGAGKTTLLTALLAFAPPEASLYFTRGWGETFDLPPRHGDIPTFLMVNEISDHLPVYSWGPYVQRAFELLAEGYSLLSTMHADTVEGAVQQLVDECDVPPSHVGHLTFVVPMRVSARDGQRTRRVTEIGMLEPAGETYRRTSVARWLPEGDRFSAVASPAEVEAVARRLGMGEAGFLDALGEREGVIERWLTDGLTSIEAIQEQVDALRSVARRQP